MDRATLLALADDLRCTVSQQRCRDFYPRVCDLDARSRAALGEAWRCATCALFAAIAENQ